MKRVRKDTFGHIGGPIGLEPMLHTLEALEPQKREPAGPNKWDEVTPSDFGPEEDYRVGYDALILKTFIEAKSEAALQWCYAKLPEGIDRYGARGFIVEERYLPMIEAAMQRDNLMSRKQFEDAMDEMNQARMQWEMDR